MEKLDKKDLLILQALDQNVRASNAQIGRYARLSKEVVQYRLKQLEKRKVLTGYWAVPQIDSTNHIYKVFIKNKSLGTAKKKEFIEYLLEQNLVSWLANTEGTWDFVFTSFVKSDWAFSQLAEDMMHKFGKHIKEKQIIKSTAMTIMNEKYLYEEKKVFASKEDSFLEQNPIPDKIDQHIIRELSKNARSSFAAMAKVVNLSAEAVSARYKKIMKRNLIIHMNPRINHGALGLSYYHIYIAINDYEKKDSINKYYIQHPNCVAIMKHIGYYDIHLEIVAREEEIEGIVEELSEEFGESISSYELLRIRKEHILAVMR